MNCNILSRKIYGLLVHIFSRVTAKLRCIHHTRELSLYRRHVTQFLSCATTIASCSECFSFPLFSFFLVLFLSFFALRLMPGNDGIVDGLHDLCLALVYNHCLMLEHVSFPILFCYCVPGNYRDIVNRLCDFCVALQPRQRKRRLAVQSAQPVRPNTGQLGRSRRGLLGIW